MGLVTRSEGEAATGVVSQTAGVQKVVTLFEYINALPDPATASAPVEVVQPVEPKAQ